jgi:hypothetical protein
VAAGAAGLAAAALLGAGELAAEGVIEAVIRARLAKAANTTLRRPAAEILGPLFIVTFPVLAQSDIIKQDLMHKPLKWFRDRGNLPRFERL